MNTRASSYLSDKCISKVLYWKNVGFNCDIRSINSSFSLKYAIVNDPLVRVDILSPTSFCIFQRGISNEATCGSIISESIICDYLIGSKRVKAQYENLINAKSSGVNAAWLLVTAYYCAFFSSIEISRIFGKFSLHLDEGEVSEIYNKAPLTMEALAFSQKPPRNFSGYLDGDRIVFVSSGERPHQAAWVNLGKVLNSVFKDRAWIDAQNLCSIVTGQKTPDPSTIRNEWNYRYAERFGTSGQKMGEKFLKLIGNHGGVSSWLSNTEWLKQGDEAIAASIAALCEVVASAVINSRARIFNTKILED